MPGRYSGGTGLTDGTLEEELDSLDDRLVAIEQGGGGGGPVSSTFVTNASGVAGANVTAALDALAASIATKADAAATTAALATKADDAATTTALAGKVSTPVGVTDGDILVRVGGAWARLPVGGEGQVLQVVGGALVWGDAPAGSSIPNVPFVRGTDATGYTAAPADMPGGDSFSVVVLMRFRDISVSGDIVNYRGGSGGFRMWWDGLLRVEVMTAGGSRTRSWFPPADMMLGNKWFLFGLSYSGGGSSGGTGSALIELKINGRVISGLFTGSTDGAYVAPTGATPTILAGQAGADEATGIDVAGVGYAASMLSTTDAANLFDAAYHAGELVQVGSILDRAWSAKSNTPGATWAGHVGAPTALTRIGGALTSGDETYPLWL
jgi:hypothetical protein